MPDTFDAFDAVNSVTNSVTTCNPWTVEAKPTNQWRVQGVTQRRITEAIALRRTEQGNTRIVLRGQDVNPWTTTTTVQPPSGWNLAGYNVRRTENECERITEDGQLRIVE